MVERSVSIDMRILCLSAVSLLAVVFSTLGEGDCAHAERGQVAQDSPHCSSHEELELPEPSRAKHVEPIGEGMPEDLQDMELGEAMSPDIGRPEVLEMERERFSKLEFEDKTTLTAKLSAKEWNELLGRFRVKGGDHEKNIELAFHTALYTTARQLEMLEEALKSKLEYLFAALSDLAYVPRTLKVIPLLERGLEVFPDLRNSILDTIYQLDYRTTKWHLDKSENDVKFSNT